MVLPSTGLPRKPCRAPGSTLPPPGASPHFSCASVSPQADRAERAGGWRGGGCSVPTVTRGRSAQSVRAGASFTRFSSPPAPAGRAGRRGRVPAGASPAELLVPGRAGLGVAGAAPEHVAGPNFLRSPRGTGRLATDRRPCLPRARLARPRRGTTRPRPPPAADVTGRGVKTTLIN